MRARSNAYRVAHPDRVRATKAATRAKHKAKISADFRRWYLENRESNIARVTAWKKANPTKTRLQYKNKKHRRKAMGGSVTPVEWAWILGTYGGRCAYCRREGLLQMDHVIALSRGGTHEEANIVPACQDCNYRKSNRPVIVFLAERAA